MWFNLTDSDNVPLESSNLHPMVFVLMWLNVLMTSGGNLLTIIVFLKEKSIYSKPANLYILNLAVADLKVGVVSLPWFNLWWHYGDWIFGEKLCKFWVIIDFTACTESMIAMLLIGWDRLWMVRNIQSYVRYQTRRRTIGVILTSWIICYIHFFIAVLLWEPLSQVWNIDYSIDCDFPPNFSLGYTIYEVIFQFVIPVIALAYINISVFVIINKRANRIHPSDEGISTISTQEDTLVGVPPSTTNRNDIVLVTRRPHQQANSNPNANPAEGMPPVNHTVEAFPTNDLQEHDHGFIQEIGVGDTTVIVSRRRHRKDRKAAMTLTLLVVTFAICWAPYNVVIIMETLSQGSVVPWVSSFTEYLLWLNSVVNPFLYVMTNLQFRKKLKKMLSGSCR